MKVCCFQKTDSTPSKLDVFGQWWGFGHHTSVKYKLDWFRAGNASIGAWPW